MQALKFNPRVVVKSSNHSLHFTRRNLTNSVQNNNNNNNNNFKPQGTSNATTGSTFANQNQSPPAAGGFDPRIPSSSPSSTASNLDQGSSHSSSVKREFQEQQPSSERTQVSGWASTQSQSWTSPREENMNTSGKTFDKSKPSHGFNDQQLGNNSNSNSTMESNLSSSLQRKNANTARDWSKRADPVNSSVASQSDWDQELVSQKLTPKKATNQNISSNQQNRKFTTTPYATSSYNNNKDNNNNNQKQSNLNNSQESGNINKGKDEHNLHNYTGSTTPQSEMSGITGYGGRSGIEKDNGSRSSSSSSINSDNNSNSNNNNNNKSGEEESVADQLSKAVSQVIGRSETNTASTGEGNPNTVLGAFKTGAEKTVEFASNIKKKAMDMVDTIKNEFSSEQSPGSSSSNKSESSSSLGPDMMYGRNTASNKQSQEKKGNGFDSSTTTAAFDQVFGSDIKPDENTLSRTKRVPPGSQSNDLGTTTGTTGGINQGGSTGSSGLGSTGSGFGGSSSSPSPQSSQSSSSSIPSGKNNNSDWNKI